MSTLGARVNFNMSSFSVGTASASKSEVPVLEATASKPEWFAFYATKLLPYFAVNDMYVFYCELAADVPDAYTPTTAIQRTTYAEEFGIKSAGEFRRVSVKACGIMQLALTHHDDLQSVVVQAGGNYKAALAAIEARVTGGAVAYVHERRAKIDEIIGAASDFAQLDKAILQVARINRVLTNTSRSIPAGVRAQLDAVEFTDLALKAKLCAQLAVVDPLYFEQYQLDPARWATLGDCRRGLLIM